MVRNPTLPDFVNPPLTEVALSVEFEPTKKFGPAEIGAYWGQILKAKFPRREVHPPLASVREHFERPPHAQQLKVEILSELPTPRFWFLNEPGTELIQVQGDRFVHNWRKQKDADVYPRFENVRQTFKEELDRLGSFLETECSASMTPVQCEVTYLNHIVYGPELRPGQVEEIISTWRKAYSDTFLKEPEHVHLGFKYVIMDPASRKPVGRLHVNVNPAFSTPGGAPILVISLTARGNPVNGQDSEAVIKFFNIGREWIVRAFASVTTPKMHKIWGRK